jgi:capsular polysaccharide biosynthesis protein
MNEDRKAPDGQVLQPTYVLAPGYYPDWEPTDQVSLADYVLVLWRRRLLIVGVTLGFGLLAFLFSMTMPKQYRATAILLVQPPSFSTELRPEPLSVETYQSLVDSGYLKSLVRQQLVEDGTLGEKESFGVLKAEIHQSGTRAQAGYSPFIDLTVTANGAEKARVIADTWAQIAIQESGGLASRGQQGTLDFIRNEYPTTRDRLTELEAQLKETEDKYDKQLQNLQDQWDRRIMAFKTEWDIGVLQNQADAIKGRLTANVVALNNLQLDIKETRDTLEQLKAEIKQHPEFVVTSKAITDDALWEKIGRDFNSGTASELQNLKLHSQVLNPVYQSLLQRVADTQVRYETQVPQEQHLKDQIASQQKELRDLNGLILEKQFELDKMTREKETALTLLGRERDYHLTSLRREVESTRETFKTLSGKWESARMTQAEQDQDIKIGSLAAAPNGPVSPRPLINTAIALVVGFMLSIMLAFLIEFIQSGTFSDDRAKSSRS